MADTVDQLYVQTLGFINVGVSDLSGIINPLAAQLDAAISLGLAPLQAELSASLDASLSLQASLSLSVTDPLASLRAALQAAIELQASLSAALALPPLQLPSVEAELSASAALAASLQARLGAIQLLIEAMLSIKIPALQLADLPLGAGPIVLLAFDGLDILAPTGTFMTLAEAGTKIQAKFAAGIGNPSPPAPPDEYIAPGDLASGFIMVTKVSAAFAALQSIIRT
jgi:hypothetical protein